MYCNFVINSRIPTKLSRMMHCKSRMNLKVVGSKFPNYKNIGTIINYN